MYNRKVNTRSNIALVMHPITRAFFISYCTIFLVTLIFLFIPDTSFSISLELSNELKGYLSQIEAKIIKVSKNDITINKGAKDNIKGGDYFQVLKRGRVITNPVNNEIIGYEREKQAIIYIKEVYDEFSVGEVIRGDGPFYIGQQVLRFRGIDTYFYPANNPLEFELKEHLPFLNWTQNESSALLKFSLINQKLILSNHKNDVLKEFFITYPENRFSQFRSHTSYKDIEELQTKPNIHELVTVDDDVIDFIILNSMLLYLTKDGLFSQQIPKNQIKKLFTIDKYLSPISIYKTYDNNYIILNTLFNDFIYRTYILDATNDYNVIKKDINMYISSQNSLLLAQSLGKERILNDKISIINLINAEIFYTNEIDNQNRINLSNACIFHDSISKIKKVYIHQNTIHIETNNTILSYLHKDENIIKKLNCLIANDIMLFVIYNKLFAVNLNSNDINLKSIRLFDEYQNVINIDIFNDRLILGIKDTKDNKIRTHIKYIYLNDLLLL